MPIICHSNPLSSLSFKFSSSSNVGFHTPTQSTRSLSKPARPKRSIKTSRIGSVFPIWWTDRMWWKKQSRMEFSIIQRARLPDDLCIQWWACNIPPTWTHPGQAHRSPHRLWTAWLQSLSSWASSFFVCAFRAAAGMAFFFSTLPPCCLNRRNSSAYCAVISIHSFQSFSVTHAWNPQPVGQMTLGVTFPSAAIL